MVDVPFPQLGSDAPPQVDVLIEPSRKGLVLGIASDGDHVVVVGGQGRDLSQSSQRRLGIEAGANLMKARVLPSGTIIAVGRGGCIFRSTDSGESFQPVRSDAHGLLCGVEAFADGRVVVVGQSGGVYFSKDDGATFEVIEQSHSSDYLWCCERLGDSLVVGAHNGTVLKIH